jgi:hypothetical protein
MKTTSCTEKKYYSFDTAPRCGAKTKSNNGTPCRCPAIKGKTRCRVHGGASSGAPISNTNALKHGDTTAESKAFRNETKQAIRLSQQSIETIEQLLN